MHFSYYSYSYCGGEQYDVGLDSGVDSIQNYLACLNVTRSDLQLFLLIVYLILPMLKRSTKARGLMNLMRVELHPMAGRGWDVFTKNCQGYTEGVTC